MFKSESLTLDSKKIKDFINKESNPFLKKSRNNFLLILRFVAADCGSDSSLSTIACPSRATYHLHHEAW